MIVYGNKIITLMDDLTYSMYTIRVDSIDYVCTAGEIAPHICVGKNNIYVTLDDAKTIEDLMINGRAEMR